MVNGKNDRRSPVGISAVNAYVEPVVSLDLDIVVKTDAIKDVCGVARKREFKVEEFEHSVNIAGHGSDLRVQLQTDARYQAFVSGAMDADVLGYRLRVARVEDVLQGKVWACMDKSRRRSKRQKDLADISRIVEKYPKLEAGLPQEVKDELDR
ncbi:MAG TPA: hypothetical protein VLH60_06455 [Sedimentisphaerales bacterium]|nr:hypothetical protein [Sedimentisphaerales bacterium]